MGALSDQYYRDESADRNAQRIRFWRGGDGRRGDRAKHHDERESGPFHFSCASISPTEANTNPSRGALSAVVTKLASIASSARPPTQERRTARPRARIPPVASAVAEVKAASSVRTNCPVRYSLHASSPGAASHKSP